jgi:hypothetical protein
MKRVSSALAAALLMAMPAAAQERDCRDDRGNERCAAEAVAAQNRLFGLTDIAELNREGAYVRRAVFVDGYGNDLLAISFIRRRGEGPVLEMAAPHSANPRMAKLTAALSSRLWERAIAADRHFDRLLQPRPREESDDITVCLHGWLARVEASDPARQNPSYVNRFEMPAIMRTAMGSACADDLAMAYAFELAELALAAAPNCDLISEQGQRNTVTRLADCLTLSGDRVAAARAHNEAQALRFLGHSSTRDAVELHRLFVDYGTARFEDRSLGHGRGIPAELGALFNQWEFVYVQPLRFNGIDAEHVEMIGYVERRLEDQEFSERADLRVRWTDVARRPVIESLEIGEFRRLPES